MVGYHKKEVTFWKNLLRFAFSYLPLVRYLFLMPVKLIDDNSKLSEQQLTLIEDFIADYNSIDRFLREALALDDQISFARIVHQYSQQNKRWPDSDLLKTVAKVRNVIVHSKTRPYSYLAVPSPELAQSLKASLDRLTNPALALPTFERKVETISVHDHLAMVLKTIKHRDYSQFPAYEDGRFRGLLTENGITRWLAQHVATKLSLIEFEDVPVKEVLESEERRTNYRFIKRNTRVDEVVDQFSSGELLEAALITANGKSSETLLGIATRWDIIRVR